MAASRDQVATACGACHAYTEPDLFPKDRWRAEVERGFGFLADSDRKIDAPPFENVVLYYEENAPQELASLPPGAVASDASTRFEPIGIPGPVPGRLSSIAFLDIVKLQPDEPPVILACDMAWGLVMSRPANDDQAGWTILNNQVRHPAQAVVADLDADGLNDLLIAELGVPMPSDDRKGQVVWLKRLPDGKYEKQVLMKDLGRVCDVRPADFDADGDLDLVVAEFGWHATGSILLLENQAKPGQQPTFKATTLDPRPGAIHVPVADLNNDGKPDFMALISQEHETVVAFLNRGDGQFDTQTIFQAPHPAFGSSGIDLVDLDGDQDLDVLLTNGDVYDSPLLKPYHGVSWLENRGVYPFTHQPIGALYGAHRARAADFDADGDLDIIATSFLAEPAYGNERANRQAEAVTLFEQTFPGIFERVTLQIVTCDYATFAIGNLDDDQTPDLVLGSFRSFDFSPLDSVKRRGEQAEAVWIWKNLAARRSGE